MKLFTATLIGLKKFSTPLPRASNNQPEHPVHRLGAWTFLVAHPCLVSQCTLHFPLSSDFAGRPSQN
jgi:hypothetical protein